MSSLKGYIVFGTALKKSAKGQQLSDDEFIETKWMKKSKLREMVKNNELTDLPILLATTLDAFLYGN